MAIIQQSAGLLFKIDGDASQLHREMRGVEAAFGRLGSNFGSVAGVATVATAAVTAVAAAAVTGAVALFNFTKQAAEYGSTLYDASIQTDLSAEAISALKIAADSSGSSLENVAGSVAKFNVLLGQAAQGNEKAEATLKRYGITAKDTDGALNQAIATIARMETQDQKAAAAKDLFKDRTAAILPVINQVDGKFDEFIETAKKLGVVLSKEDLKAADDFGDTLEVLGTQAKIAGVKFASELMPMVTKAMQSISQYMAANQDVAREWGNQVVYTVQGIQVTFGVFRQAVGDVLSFITLGLINNQNQWLVWGTVVRGVIATVTFGLSEVIRLMAYIGAKTTNTAEGQGVWLAPLAPPKQPAVGGAAKGGGGRGGGGTSAADKAEQERKKEIQAAEQVIQRKLELFRNASAEQIAILDEQLSRQEINEMDHLEKVRKLKENEARYEALLLQQFSRNAKLNADERAEAEHKATIAATKARIETLETQIAINKQDEEHAKFLQKAKKDLKELNEKERERLQLIRKRRAEKNLEYDKDRLEQLKDRTQGATLGGGGFGGGLVNAIQIMTDKTLDARDKMASATNQIAQSWQSMGGVVMGVLDGMAQALGQVIQNWILTGETGPAVMRKILAAALATIAAEAAVRAIFELAKGFASLFFNPAEAAAHFKAAALFGAVAGAAGLAGRAVAGNAFKQQANTATGSGASSGQRSGGGGGAYSSQPDQTITTGINSPGGGSGGRSSGGLGTLVIRDKSGMFDQLFEMAWERNGRMRRRMQAEFGK